MYEKQETRSQSANVATPSTLERSCRIVLYLVVSIPAVFLYSTNNHKSKTTLRSLTRQQKVDGWFPYSDTVIIIKVYDDIIAAATSKLEKLDSRRVPYSPESYNSSALQSGPALKYQRPHESRPCGEMEQTIPRHPSRKRRPRRWTTPCAGRPCGRGTDRPPRPRHRPPPPGSPVTRQVSHPCEPIDGAISALSDKDPSVPREAFGGHPPPCDNTTRTKTDDRLSGT
eukprot:1192938-Prorocentrum_minimum.AAC.1